MDNTAATQTRIVDTTYTAEGRVYTRDDLDGFDYYVIAVTMDGRHYVHAQFIARGLVENTDDGGWCVSWTAKDRAERFAGRVYRAGTIDLSLWRPYNPPR